MKKILIIGGGFVGLTLGAKLLKTDDVNLTILEVDQNRYELIKAGNYPVDEPGLELILNDASTAGKLKFINQKLPSDFDSVFICVGTPPSIISEDLPINFYSLVSVINDCLKENGFVFLRSTVKIGTTEKFAAQIHQNGRADIQVYFLPERTAEGVALLELDSLPQIIGAASNSELNFARMYLQEIGFDLIESSNAKSAEFVKLLSNAWRDTVFGISNEIALMAEIIGVDAAEIIQVANHKYPRAKIPSAGPVGGPCLYKDSYILLDSFDQDFQNKSIILKARTINEEVENKAYELILQHIALLETTPTILFIGAAFKGTPKTNDIRNGLTSNIITNLQLENIRAQIFVWDPTITRNDLLKLVSYWVEKLSGLTPNVIVIGNNSSTLASSEAKEFLNQLPQTSLVIDPWRMYRQDDTKAKIYQLGLGMVN